jgi:hypothetical protein
MHIYYGSPPTYLTIFSCFLYMVKNCFSHIEEHEMITKINRCHGKKKNTIVKKYCVLL